MAYGLHYETTPKTVYLSSDIVTFQKGLVCGTTQLWSQSASLFFTNPFTAYYFAIGYRQLWIMFRLSGPSCDVYTT